MMRLKPKLRRETVVLEMWMCSVEAHRHSTKQVAQRCIDRERTKQARMKTRGAPMKPYEALALFQSGMEIKDIATMTKKSRTRIYQLISRARQLDDSREWQATLMTSSGFTDAELQGIGCAGAYSLLETLCLPEARWARVSLAASVLGKNVCAAIERNGGFCEVAASTIENSLGPLSLEQFCAVARVKPSFIHGGFVRFISLSSIHGRKA